MFSRLKNKKYLISIISAALILPAIVLIYFFDLQKTPTAQAQASCGTCSEADPILDECGTFWANTQTFTINLSHKPALGEILDFDLKAHTYAPNDDKCSIIGTSVIVNGVGGLHCNLSNCQNQNPPCCYKSWTLPQVCGNASSVILSIAADLDGDKIVDWNMGNNTVTIVLGPDNNSYTSLVQMDSFICPVVSNHLPTASLSPDTATANSAPAQITFTLDGKDDEGISSWSLDCNNDGTAEFNDLGDPNGLTKVCNYNAVNDYEAKLIVTDTDGVTAEDISNVRIGELSADFTIEDLDNPGVLVGPNLAAAVQISGSDFKFDASNSIPAGSLQFRWSFDDGNAWTKWQDDPVLIAGLSAWNIDTGAKNRHEKNIVLEVKNTEGMTAQKKVTIYVYYLDIEAGFATSGTVPFTPTSSIDFFFDNELAGLPDFGVACNGTGQVCHDQYRQVCPNGNLFTRCMNTGSYTGMLDCQDTYSVDSFSNYTQKRTYGNIYCSYGTPGNYSIEMRISAPVSQGGLQLIKKIPITVSNNPPSTRLSAVYPGGSIIASGNTQNITINQGENVTFTTEVWDCDGLVDLTSKTTNMTGGGWIDSDSAICSFAGQDYSVYDDGGAPGIILNFPNAGNFSYNVFAQDNTGDSSTSTINLQVQVPPETFTLSVDSPIYTLSTNEQNSTKTKVTLTSISFAGNVDLSFSSAPNTCITLGPDDTRFDPESVNLNTGAHSTQFSNLWVKTDGCPTGSAQTIAIKAENQSKGITKTANLIVNIVAPSPPAAEGVPRQPFWRQVIPW